MIESKLVSSLEKCFYGDDLNKFEQLKSLSVMKNERFSFQLAVRADENAFPKAVFVEVKLKGKLSRYATTRLVECVPSVFPCYPNDNDDNYIDKRPGLYPDLLLPAQNRGKFAFTGGLTRAFLITVELKGDFAGDVNAQVVMSSSDEVLCSQRIKIHIIDALMPKQTLINTQWFHGDCLATYYGIKVFSAKWWKTVENFLSTAAKNGQNMILTPIFTPALDTEVGGERPTVQLVDVRTDGEGNYSFAYEKLDKWLDICLKIGFEYFEITHFFTQWGAYHAPKIMAETPSGRKRIFGWETDASGEEYSRFLGAFIPDFLRHMKKRGLDERCYFHVSDEPNEANLEQYRKAKAVVEPLLRGFPVTDALSHFDFYAKGIVSLPVVSTNHLQPFFDAGVRDLWAYYCCGQAKNVSNRFFAMPGARTRCIGFQLFKFDIKGFLHWGYNFYYSQHSTHSVNPYLDSTGGCFTPSGDCYSVYPGENGKALESIRLVVFYEALEDLRACSLCAELIGKEQTVALIESALGEVRFDKCPSSSAPLLAARENVNRAIENAITAKKRSEL